jgi:hypothetical protein
LSGFLPVAIAAAWVPVRSDLPNTDVALLLVLCLAVAAMMGGRGAVLVGALASATAFDFFDTPPYGQLFMTRGRDVATTVVLVGVGLLVGELTVRLRTYRNMAVVRGADFTVMSAAAELMAFGEDAAMVVAALAGELVSRLDLADCQFELGRPVGDRPYVARDGELVSPGPASPESGLTEVDLPVWAGKDIVGRFRLALRPGALPGRERLLAAVGIADQAGAALAAGRQPTPAPSTQRWLRLVR